MCWFVCIGCLVGMLVGWLVNTVCWLVGYVGRLDMLVGWVCWLVGHVGWLVGVLDGIIEPKLVPGRLARFRFLTS